ncbi:MAG: FAD-dependent thymidylate synthase [Patescibacteria group bacterium]
MENNYVRPSWDEYFMKITDLVGNRGTCDRGRSGCVITKEKRIISTGYVGSPAGLKHCDELGHEMHTIVNEDNTESRHCIRTTHAEQNAICQASRFGVSLKDSTLYCRMTPCYTCAKMIINSGITRVVAASDYHAGSRSKEIFSEAGVKFELLSQTMTTYTDMGNHLGSETNNETKKHRSIEAQLGKAEVFLYDEFNPEDVAMLQALYSRSPESVATHVNNVKASGSGKFMEKFYVGYGHKSIADCGSTTLFIEKLSILADKAIQDWPLYNGQETSTRYVDMSAQPIIDPMQTIESKTILDGWMNFYMSSQTAVQEHLKKTYPIKPEENEKVYDKAIKARAFDITRGFLPAGITTQLSWHTNLRQAWDKLLTLRHHPLPEVKEIAQQLCEKLKEKYPSSFCHEKHDEQEEYNAKFMANHNYFENKVVTEFSFSTTLRYFDLLDYHDLLANRPAKTVLPHFLTELGTLTFDFLLDYGSFRDIQRHRNGVCRMPLHTTKFGFNNWYLAQLPLTVRSEALGLIEQQTKRLEHLNCSNEIKQYYIPLGFNLPCRVTYGLPAAVYVIELRSGKPVHPTLRKIAHQMYHAIHDKYPLIKLHVDLEEDDWDSRRGLQDITLKQ